MSKVCFDLNELSMSVDCFFQLNRGEDIDKSRNYFQSDMFEFLSYAIPSSAMGPGGTFGYAEVI
jgi:hypothetical protein